MVVIAAMVLDALLGEPAWLWSRVPHPAVMMGRVIGFADDMFNAGSYRRAKGVMVVVALVVMGAGIGWAIEAVPTVIPDIVIGAILLAQRSLVDHVRAVADALRGSIAEARREVAKIVGRDTADMTRPDIARAAIESAAENLSDGVIAPIFWFLIAGLPGIIVYKFINTADSMIGYRTPKHERFGWAAARLDDGMNLIPARLTALAFWVFGANGSWADIRRDACLHRSPNAGWPEAALSRNIGISLSGPRSYDGETKDFPWVNAGGRKDAGPADINRAVRMLWAAWGVTLTVCVVAAVAHGG